MNKILAYFGKPKFNLVYIVSVSIVTNLFYSEYYLVGLLVLIFGTLSSCLVQILWGSKQ